MPATHAVLPERIQYHLDELRIALDAGDERRILPELRDADRAILDIGCGIGQSLVALNCAGRTCVGVDVDEEAIRYGAAHYGDRIRFIGCDARAIPLPAGSFDLVFSRVSLPYTNVPKVIAESRRLLRAGGRLWMTLHSRRMAGEYVAQAARTGDLKRLARMTYMLANGYLLKLTGRVVPFLDGRYESWQDPVAMVRLLRGHGFEAEVREVGRHAVMEGRLPK